VALRRVELLGLADTSSDIIQWRMRAEKNGDVSGERNISGKMWHFTD
jgi:hypothetical protein